MDLPAALRRPARELFVLALGSAAGLALAWAGATVHEGLRTAGEVAVARIAGGAEDAVRAEWERLLRAAEPPLAASGETFRWSVGEALLEPSVAPSPAPAPGRPSVAATLLEEAEHRELVEQDPTGALDLVLEAREKAASDPERDLAQLRALQLAARLGREDLVEPSWEALRAAPLGEVREGLPLRLLAWLSLPPGLRASGSDRPVLSESELEGLFLAEDSLVLGPPEAPEARFEPAALLVLVCERGDFHPPPLARRATAALAKAAGGLPEIEEEGRWQPLELLDRPFLARREGATVTGFFHAPRALSEALVARLALPRGFALDFTGANEALGVSLRPPFALPGSDLAVTLRHADPEGIARAESSRLRLLRGALFGLAGTAVAGGFLTARLLARQRRLDALKSAFIAGVSHDLRTPLASILLLAENLEDGVVAPAARARYHRALRREATRLRRLVDDVLDFSRLERGRAPELQCEVLDLAPFLDELEAELGARVGEAGRAFRCERGALPETATLDAHALRRALANLVDNALKHGRGAVRLDVSARAGRLRFGVEDEGPGVPVPDRERVFQPFERRTGEGGHVGGTGLGLAIVRSIARAHGGEARVAAATGGSGARFELDLPSEEATLSRAERTERA